MAQLQERIRQLEASVGSPAKQALRQPSSVLGHVSALASHSSTPTPFTMSPTSFYSSVAPPGLSACPPPGTSGAVAGACPSSSVAGACPSGVLPGAVSRSVVRNLSAVSLSQSTTDPLARATPSPAPKETPGAHEWDASVCAPKGLKSNIGENEHASNAMNGGAHDAPPFIAPGVTPGGTQGMAASRLEEQRTGNQSNRQIKMCEGGGGGEGEERARIPSPIRAPQSSTHPDHPDPSPAMYSDSFSTTKAVVNLNATNQTSDSELLDKASIDFFLEVSLILLQIFSHSCLWHI